MYSEPRSDKIYLKRFWLKIKHSVKMCTIFSNKLKAKKKFNQVLYLQSIIYEKRWETAGLIYNNKNQAFACVADIVLIYWAKNF